MSLVTGGLFAALTVLSAGSPVVSTDPPKVGEAFPLLPFPSLEDGELMTMADFRGTKVLLIQFASW